MKKEYKISFDHIKWLHTKTGVEEKVIFFNNQKLRLLKFHKGFEEKDWCSKGHFGCVLEGSLSIIFKKQKISFSKGDLICIDAGENSRHKVFLKKSELAILFLIENLPNCE
ncbi:hypothetical protein [uncultured Winogradskyella sp.]|uniref:hypothetical protein n=1 Tax=uncultured Winogradskyella sp. TaxID=395353 RepID=UPI00262B18BB|nr:hypothetical protein [uncultured Winogradskyella sp.]